MTRNSEDTLMTRSSRLSNQRGITLITTLLLLLLFLSLGAFALQLSGLDFKITTNQTTGTQTLYVAESGLMHAMAVINNVGVINFTNDVVANWGTLFPASNSIPGAPQLTYTVSVTSYGTAPTVGILTSRATGYDGSARVIEARLRYGPINGVGALYLAADDVAPTFGGTSLTINGNDHLADGTLNPSGPSYPGIATHSSLATTEVVSALSTSGSNPQINDVTGAGFVPYQTPSVAIGAGPSTSYMNTLANNVLTQNAAQVVQIPDSSITSGTTLNLGSQSAPQITELTASSVKVAGNIVGYGILIVDGSITITGTMNFYGLVIVRGITSIGDPATGMSGNAMIVGSLWTSSVDIQIAGSATLDYSSQALTTYASAVAGNANPMPYTMVVNSWREVF